MKNKSTLIKCAAVLTVVAALFSCDPEDGVNGQNSLISTAIEASGVNCGSGGLQVNYGLDANGNGVLEEAEIQNTDYICNGTDGVVELDHLTRIPAGSPDFASCGTDWLYTEHESWRLMEFNKHDYPGADAILFVPSIVNFTEGNKVYLELFNITDNVPIAGSTVIHDNTAFVFKFSGDIYESLPDYPVTLAIRVKNSIPDGCGGTGTFSYLYILRE